MTTLAGGATIATVGTSAEENTTITNILQTTFQNVTEVTSVAVTSSSVNTISTNLFVGSFEATAVLNETVAAVNPGGLAVVNTDNSVSTSGNTITNLVVDSGVGGLFLGGSGNASTVTGVIFNESSSTSLVVGNAGSSIIDGSRSTQNMTVVSGAGNDTIVSGIGNDRVSIGDVGVANGGGGADTLIGGAGAATLGGGGGADSIVAGSGGGMLIGESGNDTMVGGAGKDIFIYTSGGGNDVLSGFDPASDTLALANFSDIAAAGLSLLDIINRATVSGGNTIITMPDGSTITIAGATGINVNWFAIK